METSGKGKNNPPFSPGIIIENYYPGKTYSNREIYRHKITIGARFSWRVSYKNTELIISSSQDIRDLIAEPLIDIYRDLEFVTEREPSFLKSFSPVTVKAFYPSTIRKMCRLSSEFNVGPMAAVAGTVNDYLALRVPGSVRELFIENGGDLFIRSSREVKTGIFVDDHFFKDRLSLKIMASDTPCGLCSSSGTFGHSLSMGKCDLAVVLSRSSISADAAATAVANSISTVKDIEKALEKYKKFSSVLGLLIIKDEKIGIWGKFELEYT